MKLEFDEGMCYDFREILQDLLGNLSSLGIQQLRHIDISKYNEMPDIVAMYNDLKASMYTPIGFVENMISIVSDTISYVVDYEKALIGSVNNDLPSSQSVSPNSFGSGNNSSSINNNNNGDYIESYSFDSSYSNSDAVNVPNYSSKVSGNSSYESQSTPEKNVNEISINDIIADLLIPFGVTGNSVLGISKNNKGYVITLKNPNADERWQANNIKEYYIKDGRISGVLTGDNTYVKIENGKLLIDETSKNLYNSLFASVGVAGSTAGCFANKTSYNTNENKEIFKKFYPNATDEDFNNFCEKLGSVSNKCSEISKKIIETSKNSFADLSVKNGYNNLVVENNSIKIDCKSFETELYAYESSKLGINYAEEFCADISFNDAVATDLSQYLKSTYSIDVDVNSFVGSVN